MSRMSLVVAEILREAIKRYMKEIEYVNKEKLSEIPIEITLKAGEFENLGVSRVTIYRAFKMLTELGFLKERGKKYLFTKDEAKKFGLPA